MSVSNENFKISSNTKKLITDVVKLTELIPKRYYFIKNKLLSVSFDLLERIHNINNSNGIEVEDIKYMQTDLIMIDYLTDLLVTLKCISIKSLERVVYQLTKINKMSNVWIKNIKKARDSDKG